MKMNTLFNRKLSGILIAVLLLGLLTGCTVDDPGYMITSDDSVVQIVDENNEIITIDDTTGVLTTTDFSHYEINKGESYYIQANSASLDAGLCLNMTVVTSNSNEWVHVIWVAESSDAMTISIYENAVVSTPGVILTPNNRDRNSANMPDTIFRNGDIFTNTGTLIWEWQSGGGNIIGSGQELSEIILAQDTTYLFCAESRVNGNVVNGELSFYEHANR